MLAHLWTQNNTCKSPWPSPLKVTEGGTGCKLIWILDPGHSRSSIASFKAADWGFNTTILEESTVLTAHTNVVDSLITITVKSNIE